MIERARITGVVLAGGRATRMGHRDKGLETFRGEPLAAHALRRLAPQVGSVVISANRHLDRYAALGPRVVVDVVAGVDAFAGPLAGFAAVLARCETDWVAAVPCDAPFFPMDLVATLAGAARDDALAYARTPVRTHPVFCLVPRSLASSLAAYLADGGRAVRGWQATVDAVAVDFDDEAAFGNLNTIAELREAEARG